MSAGLHHPEWATVPSGPWPAADFDIGEIAGRRGIGPGHRSGSVRGDVSATFVANAVTAAVPLTRPEVLVGEDHVAAVTEAPRAGAGAGGPVHVIVQVVANDVS